MSAVAKDTLPAGRSLAPGLAHWTARHPEWHPGDFGAEVGSFAAEAGDELLLIDPLVADDGASLDGLVRERVRILITIGYHVRSSVPLWERWHRDVPVTIHGPPQAGRRLRGGAAEAFSVLEPGDEGPAGVRAFAIGRPRRGERPLWIPSHDALAFGDALVVTPEGELRMWSPKPVDDDRVAFFRDRFAPTLAPLLELPVKRVLVTHGAPVTESAAQALRHAVDAPPWYHPG